MREVECVHSKEIDERIKKKNPQVNENEPNVYFQHVMNHVTSRIVDRIHERVHVAADGKLMKKNVIPHQITKIKDYEITYEMFLRNPACVRLSEDDDYEPETCAKEYEFLRFLKILHMAGEKNSTFSVKKMYDSERLRISDSQQAVEFIYQDRKNLIDLRMSLFLLHARVKMLNYMYAELYPDLRRDLINRLVKMRNKAFDRRKEKELKDYYNAERYALIELICEYVRERQRSNEADNFLIIPKEFLDVFNELVRPSQAEPSLPPK
jgi:hypothetical protein